MPPKRSFTASDKRVVGSRQRWKCAKCGTLLPASFEVDHDTPLHRGGKDDLDNAKACCNACHAEKTLAERIEFEATRSAAIRKAKADAVNDPFARPEAKRRLKRPLNGQQSLLDADVTSDSLESRLLRFAYLPPPSFRRSTTFVDA